MGSALLENNGILKHSGIIIRINSRNIVLQYLMGRRFLSNLSSSKKSNRSADLRNMGKIYLVSQMPSIRVNSKK